MQGASTVSRMLFLPDGTLLVSTWGEPGQVAQDKMGLSGKILRYNPDGTIPKDNPFVGKEGYRPEIYTLGHRTPESLVWHEPTKTIWESEMGPNGGDEINVIKAGGNYGWPLVSLGRSYAGPYQPGGFQAEGMTAPVVNFVPSISTTGMTFYTGDTIPGVEGQSLHRRRALRRDPGHGSYPAHRLQQRHGRDPPRDAARGQALAHPRHPPGSGRAALRDHGRAQRGIAPDRAG